MTLSDRTGDMNAKMWDGTVTPPPVGGVIKLRAQVTEYNGRLQLRVNKLREAEEGEYDMAQLVPCAPYPPQQMLSEINDTLNGMKNETLRVLVRELLNMAGDKLMYYPAAQRLHHAERSGLLHHTTSMLHTAKAMLKIYPWLDGDLLCAGVIAHDLSKIYLDCRACSGIDLPCNDADIPGRERRHAGLRVWGGISAAHDGCLAVVPDGEKTLLDIMRGSNGCTSGFPGSNIYDPSGYDKGDALRCGGWCSCSCCQCVAGKRLSAVHAGFQRLARTSLIYAGHSTGSSTGWIHTVC